MAQADPYDYLMGDVASPPPQSGGMESIPKYEDPYAFLGVAPGVVSPTTQHVQIGSPQREHGYLDQFMSGLGLGFGPELQGTEDYLNAPAGNQLTLPQSIYNARSAKEDFEREHPGTAQATELIGSLPTLAVANELTPGLPSALRSMNLAERMAGGAASGAEAGLLQSRITGGDPGMNALTGGLIGFGMPAVGSGLRNALSPKIEPSVRDIARNAERLGVNLRPSQIATSRVLQWLDRATASGGNEKQMKDFTRALSKTFGADTDALTDDALDAAEQSLKTRADSISSNTSAVLSPALNRGMAVISGNLRGLVKSDQAAVREAIREVRSSFVNGQLNGKTYQLLTQRGGAVANLASGSPAVKEAGGALKELLDDAIEQGSPPGIRDQWKEVRSQFRNFHAIKPLAVRNPAGLVDPASLAGKISKMPDGDLRDLAHAAPFLPRPNAAGAERLTGRGPYFRVGLGAGLGVGLGEAYLGNISPKTLAIGAGVAATTEGAKIVTGAMLRSPAYRNMVLQTRPAWTTGGALPNALIGAVNELNAQGESDGQ